MSSSGRSQREAVTVIFRLFAALERGDRDLAGSLIEKARALDSYNVNAELLSAVSEYLVSGPGGAAKQRLREAVMGTPYEPAVQALIGESPNLG